MTAAAEKAWTHTHREPTGKGLTWASDMLECAALGWYSRWTAERWEQCGASTPGAVEDLARLREFRAEHTDGSDLDWQRWLDQHAADERAGVHRKEVRLAKRSA